MGYPVVIVECSKCGRRAFTAEPTWNTQVVLKFLKDNRFKEIINEPDDDGLLSSECLKCIVIHGWNTESKSLTACGLGWIYGRSYRGKEPLVMVDKFTSVTCKRCLKSGHLRIERC